ncbi:glutamate formimidoyltransferase [Geotoga petraea]|jgi:glutamate formiminotransferase|uniref:Glutamate formimidoyltransferase n=1 Tax=Geotoga petraea TaxID=28234 RepID=A0A1G6K8W6_9BACT|nr:glutamate formimidoyltransferase [Geotoga petraea]MDK2946002.1 glutamate formiminotransferase / 5-formyltetrahydrofolate cyclo-ligase [Geotoga sp.]TGG88464.1 glutamate formimidoyltransferase [Geotoga petraea]SDC27387.1 glutamate formiminotransferase [Geotoga petraea]
MKLLGAVPNISEGRNKELIDEIVKLAEKYDNIWILSTNMDEYYNRTMLSIAGKPICVENFLFDLTEFCSNNIDLNKHKGEHPRIGAVDVIPLIPIMDVSEKEASEIADRLSKRISNDLNIPIYSYEKSTNKNIRKHISYIRKGGFESLKEKMKDENWKPDYGPDKPHPKSGATIVGVRDFLINLDFYINSKNRWFAEQIRRELIMEIPGSFFLDKKSDKKYVISVNASVNDVNLIDLYFNIRKIIEHFECELEKIEIPTPLTSSILVNAFGQITGSKIENAKTIEEMIIKSL